MSDLIRIVAVVAIAAYVIGRQLVGEPLRGKRVVMLPLILAIVGVADLASSHMAAGPADVVCLVIGGLLATTIGVAQGRLMRLESRAGSLWGQLPPKGLWLWVALVASRVAMTLIADGVNARLAASGATILLMLGVNRLAQAAVVVPRAMSAGIPFAPEKDGTSFLAGLTAPRNATRPGQPEGSAATTAGIDWRLVSATVGGVLSQRRQGHQRIR